MSQEETMSTKSRLDQVYREAPRIVINRCSRIVCMSDCHRGVGNRGDNFLFNQNLFMAALQYYYDRCFTYIELGDGDELWENVGMKRIMEVHNDIFALMNRFYRQGRFLQLYGNHDRKKKAQGYIEKHCGVCCVDCGCGDCGCRDCGCQWFEGLRALEGIVLQDKDSGKEILLVHGHQGDFLNDTLWWFAAFMVRLVWRRLELLGVYDPTSTAKNYKKRKNTEKKLESWAQDNQVMLIAGHTHRPVLPQPGKGLYFNDGSCVHPRSITALEIENGALTLVKWSVEVRHGRYLSVEREVLEGPHLISSYYAA